MHAQRRDYLPQYLAEGRERVRTRPGCVASQRLWLGGDSLSHRQIAADFAKRVAAEAKQPSGECCDEKMVWVDRVVRFACVWVFPNYCEPAAQAALQERLRVRIDAAVREEA